jgi:F-type H+-transporting ATPase subunit gamma
MINLRSSRKRISSITSTRKITKAMQLVAANKLSKAQELFAENTSILETINNISGQVFSAYIDHDSKLLEHNPNSKIFILVTSDKGLCGSYNSAVIKNFNKQSEQLKASNIDINLILIGKKAKNYYKNIKEALSYDNVLQDYEQIAEVITQEVSQIIRLKQSSITICYNHFKNAISYDAVAKLIWPFSIEKSDNSNDETLEVDPWSILKLYLKINILNALLVSNASELSARMISMDNATRNSEALIEQLTLKLNRSRQAMITKELIEIISGAEAL